MKFYFGYDKPYIYAYCPQDSEDIMADALTSLQEQGVLFCRGGQASKKELRRVEAAHAVMLFVTKASTDDPDFHQVVNRAVQCGKNILTVYLEDVALDNWGHMQLDSAQALFRYQLDSEEFERKLTEAAIFRDMAVTKQQKQFQKRRGFSLVAVPIFAAVVLFFAVVNPLLIVPAKATERQLEAWGLTREDLESIKELRIVGNQVFDTFVHAWYEGNDRSMVMYDMEQDGSMKHQTPIPAGTIDDLSIFAMMPNLEILELEGQQITDITPLLSLKNLRELSLDCNPISSLEGIGALENLEELILSCTDISDISPAFNCPNLRHLQIDNTYVSNLEGIQKLQNLDSLFIENVPVSDVSMLSSLPRLDYFSAFTSRVTKIPEFQMTTSRYIDVDSSQVGDYSPLANIKDFGMLRMHERDLGAILPYIEGKPIEKLLWAGLEINSLEDLSGIIIKPGGELNLAGCSIRSLDGIEHFEGIEALDFKYADNLADLSPILTLNSLKHLTISSDMRERAEAQLQGAHFEIEYRDD